MTSGFIFVAQPFVRVDEDVAVMLAPGLHPLGDGRYGCAGERLRHAPGPIQSPKLKPEIRS